MATPSLDDNEKAWESHRKVFENLTADMPFGRIKWSPSSKKIILSFCAQNQLCGHRKPTVMQLNDLSIRLGLTDHNPVLVESVATKILSAIARWTAGLRAVEHVQDKAGLWSCRWADFTAHWFPASRWDGLVSERNADGQEGGWRVQGPHRAQISAPQLVKDLMDSKAARMSAASKSTPEPAALTNHLVPPGTSSAPTSKKAIVETPQLHPAVDRSHTPAAPKVAQVPIITVRDTATHSPAEAHATHSTSTATRSESTSSATVKVPDGKDRSVDAPRDANHGNNTAPARSSGILRTSRSMPTLPVSSRASVAQEIQTGRNSDQRKAVSPSHASPVARKLQGLSRGGSTTPNLTNQPSPTSTNILRPLSTNEHPQRSVSFAKQTHPKHIAGVEKENQKMTAPAGKIVSSSTHSQPKNNKAIDGHSSLSAPQLRPGFLAALYKQPQVPRYRLQPARDDLESLRQGYRRHMNQTVREWRMRCFSDSVADLEDDAQDENKSEGSENEEYDDDDDDEDEYYHEGDGDEDDYDDTNSVDSSMARLAATTNICDV